MLQAWGVRARRTPTQTGFLLVRLHARSAEPAFKESVSSVQVISACRERAFITSTPLAAPLFSARGSSGLKYQEKFIRHASVSPLRVVTIFLFFAHRQPVRSVQWKTWRLKLWASLSLEFKVLLQCNNCPAGFIKVGLEILWFVCLSHCTFESKPNRLGIVFFSPTAATLSYITQALTRREEQSICLAQ